LRQVLTTEHHFSSIKIKFVDHLWESNDNFKKLIIKFSLKIFWNFLFKHYSHKWSTNFNFTNFFLKDFSYFQKNIFMLRKAPKKIFIEFEVGVKFNFENSQFSYFSMGVKISKIQNSKTIRDKKILILTSNWVFSSSLMSWYQNLKNPKFLKPHLVLSLNE
jgi:hypothetical protein